MREMVGRQRCIVYRWHHGYAVVFLAVLDKCVSTCTKVCIANIHMVACPPLHPLQHSAVLCVQHCTVRDVMYLSSLLWLQEIAV